MMSKTYTRQKGGNTCKGASAKRRSLKEQEEECENKNKVQVPKRKKTKKDQEQIYTFNLVLGLVLWISRTTFKSSDFQNPRLDSNGNSKKTWNLRFKPRV